MLLKQLGRVRWFDNLSGEGMIRVGEKSIYVHWSAIVAGLNQKHLPKNAHKQPKLVWCVLYSGMPVFVDVMEDSHFTQISKVYTEVPNVA